MAFKLFIQYFCGQGGVRLLAFSTTADPSCGLTDMKFYSECYFKVQRNMFFFVVQSYFCGKLIFKPRSKRIYQKRIIRVWKELFKGKKGGICFSFVILVTKPVFCLFNGGRKGVDDDGNFYVLTLFLSNVFLPFACQAKSNEKLVKRSQKIFRVILFLTS